MPTPCLDKAVMRKGGGGVMQICMMSDLKLVF